MKKLIGVILTMCIVLILLIGVNELPEFGNPNNPNHNYVSDRYIEKSIEETGAKNIVAGVILDYRAFDTFVEATVLFTSIIIMISILKGKDKENGGGKE